ncbi:MAG: replication initiation protein [Fusobacterium polymorphum]
MNEIVKYRNELNKVALRNFKSKELDLFIAIISRLRDKEEEVIFSFDYLKSLIQYETSNSSETFYKELKSMYNKLIKCVYGWETEAEIVRFVLFTEYTIDKKNKTIKVGINKKYSWVLNAITDGLFTRFELEEFVKLKSSYTKEFYRRMKQFRNTGFWNVNLDEFKRLMDIPVNYRICDIDAKVLKPIQKELREKYGLKIQKTYDTKGRGRPAVSGLIFTFSKEESQSRKKIKEEKKEIKKLADIFIHRKVRMRDQVTGMFNILTIKSINEQKNGIVMVKIQNVDDSYEQNFKFNSMEHFENWFKKYVI